MFSPRLRPRGVLAFLAAVSFAFSSFTPTYGQSSALHRAVGTPLLLYRAPLFFSACLPILEAISAPGGEASAEADERLGPCTVLPAKVLQGRLLCKEVSLGTYSCGDGEVELRSTLLAMGKKGSLILRARESALQILRGNNACSAWYKAKDPDPASTFETLEYEVDEKAVDYIAERGTSALLIYRNPYVATALQAGGSYQTITLNAGGAFFRSAAYVRLVPKEGGAGRFVGSRYLRVGPYSGNTPEARVTTLLHEFGHVIDLLELDQGDVDGKSVHNTDIVVSHCRDQIADSMRQATLTVQR